MVQRSTQFSDGLGPDVFQLDAEALMFCDALRPQDVRAAEIARSTELNNKCPRCSDQQRCRRLAGD